MTRLCTWTMLLGWILITGSGCDGTVEPAGDDDTTSGDDDAFPGDDDACGDETWPDLTAEPADSCAPEVPPETWQLSVTWAWGEELACPSVHAGRFVDTDGDGIVSDTEPMQFWFESDGADGGDDHQVLVDLDGALHSDVLADTWRSSGTVGEVVGASEGMEYLVWYYFHGADETWIAAHGAAGPLWETSLHEDQNGYLPWLTDLEGDGVPEILVQNNILDATTGVILGAYEASMDISPPVAADLDRDGQREILSSTNEVGRQEVNIYEPDGTVRATCWTGEWSYAGASFAVADLDADEELEFLAATTGYLIACDSDGKLLSETFVDMTQPSLVGVGQLDMDAPPEIVVSDCYGVFAFDHDFTQIWRYDVSVNPYDWNWLPMALADLDGDGMHEVIVRDFGDLIVLDGAGAERATFLGPTYCSSNFGAPAVVDVDADGLAEIVVPAWPDMAVVENPLGGWLVDGANEPWPSVNKYPGDRRPDGTIPPPAEDPWGDPLRNVWQGLPAGTPDLEFLSELSGEIAGVCEDGDHAEVIVYVYNHGYLETTEDCTLNLYSQADGSLVGSSIAPAGLPSGTGRAFEIQIEALVVAGGLELRVDEGDVIAECDEGNNSAVWPVP